MIWNYCKEEKKNEVEYSNPRVINIKFNTKIKSSEQNCICPVQVNLYGEQNRSCSVAVAAYQDFQKVFAIHKKM